MVRGGEGALSPFRQRRGRKVRKGPHGVRENAGRGGWKAGVGGGLRAPFGGGAGGEPPARSGRRGAAGSPALERMGKGVDTSPDAGACRNGPAPVAGRRRSPGCVPARVRRRSRVRDQVRREGPREAGVPEVTDMRGMAAPVYAGGVGALSMLPARVVVRPVVRPPRGSLRRTLPRRPATSNGPPPGSLRAATAPRDPLLKPRIQVRLEPADGAAAQPDRPGKGSPGHHRPDRPPRQAGAGLDLGHPQDAGGRIRGPFPIS